MIAASIAASVDQQHTATSEIARTLQQAAMAAREVTISIGAASAASMGTGTAAVELRTAAGGLSKQAEHLSAEVQIVLADVRAV